MHNKKSFSFRNVLTAIILMVCLACAGCGSTEKDTPPTPVATPATTNQVTVEPIITVPPLDVPEVITEAPATPTPTAEPTVEPEVVDNEVELLHVTIEDIIEEYTTGIDYYQNRIEYFRPSLAEDEAVKYNKLQASLDAYYDNSVNLTEFTAEEMRNVVADAIAYGNEDAFFGCSDEKIARIARADSNYLSLYVSRYGYMGGAHPDYSYTGVNFDSQTGEKLSIYDVITDMDKLMDIVAEKLEKDYSDIFEYLDLDYLNRFRSDAVTDSEERPGIDFVITSEGIAVIFNTYILGPYVIGAQIIDIYYDEAPEIFVEKLLDVPSKYVLLNTIEMPVKLDFDGDGERETVVVDVFITEDDEMYYETYNITCGQKSLTLEHYAFTHENYVVCIDGHYYLYFYESVEAQTVLSIIDLSTMEVVDEQTYIYEMIEDTIQYGYEELADGARYSTSAPAFTDPDKYMH